MYRSFFDKAKRFGYAIYMPTIFRQNGFVVMIYLNDHTSAHVHVFKAEAEVIISLGNEATPPQVRENIGMSRRDERAALKIAGECQAVFWDEWRRIHGKGKDRSMGD